VARAYTVPVKVTQCTIESLLKFFQYAELYGLLGCRAGLGRNVEQLVHRRVFLGISVAGPQGLGLRPPVSLGIVEIPDDAHQCSQAERGADKQGADDDQGNPEEGSDEGKEAPQREGQESRDAHESNHGQGHSGNGQGEHKRGVVLGSVDVGNLLDVGSDLVGERLALLGHVGNVWLAILVIASLGEANGFVAGRVDFA
jgi:hypothetical protein